MNTKYRLPGIFLSLILVLLIPQIGAAQAGLQFQEGVIRITGAGQLGDTLSVWGDVRVPGRYLVPRNSSVAQVLQFTGGPTGSRIGGGGQNVWSRTRITISISQYENETGVMNYHQFNMKYDDEISKEMRNFRLTNDDILTIEVKQAPGFLDVLGVVGPILGTITTSYLFYDRFIR